ncbi:hypothetical protein [Nocardia sp. CA-135398]|uniref:hypothetical protein n=1 Tax=Nocardia sp. CA-135398 TaxID=3239977 RepID=UPI003D97A5DE
MPCGRWSTIGQQVSALDISADRWFTATTALLHYVLGAASQNAANHERAQALGPEPDPSAYLKSVAQSWRGLSREEFPIIRALADRGLDHDNRLQFMDGIDLIVAGITARPPTP